MVDDYNSQCDTYDSQPLTKQLGQYQEFCWMYNFETILKWKDIDLGFFRHFAGYSVTLSKSNVLGSQ